MKPLPVRRDKPVLVYGTSIAQGGVASRPGLAWTALLERKLDRPVINLAFSGNGRLEPEVLDLIAGQVNAAFANFSKGLTALGNKDDININVIHPGSTQTDRVEMLFQQYAKAQDKTVEQVRAEAVSKAGLRRIGQPEDIAELAVYLASAKARHIQGTAIVVDGGGTPGYY